ncbi:MAG TPA: hypothetical protein VKG45_09730 [Actinomycetes bacterium]|nr:hypothetical protein [Actinomycetes bacterium]
MRPATDPQDPGPEPGRTGPSSEQWTEHPAPFEPRAASDPWAPSLAATVIEWPGRRSLEMSSAPDTGRRLGATVVEWRRRGPSR